MRLLTELSSGRYRLPQGFFNRPYWPAWLLAGVVLLFLLFPWPLYDKLWAIAYGICPQRPSHSLFFGGVQMPIEAREGGIFAGFLLGLTFLVAAGRVKTTQVPAGRILVVLAGFIVLMGVDGLNAFAYDLYLPTPYAPNLPMRLGTGLLAGLSIAGIFIPIFNQTVWQSGLPVASFTSGRDLGTAVLLSVLFWMAGLSGWNRLLYPVSMAAIAGQVILMTGLGTMLMTIGLQREGRFLSFLELAPLLLWGLVIVAVILGIASGFRYLLFGLGPLPAWR